MTERRPLRGDSRSESAWVATDCGLCGAASHATERLFAVAHADAPDRHTYIVRCTSCRLIRLDPRPSPGSIGTYYENSYLAFGGRSRSKRLQQLWELLRDAAAGAPLPSASRPFRSVLGMIGRHRFDITVTLGSEPKRVLDVGCGFGDLLIYLSSRGCEVFGVDFDERAAATAASYGLRVHVGDPERIPAPDGYFTTAVLSHSLEHIPDPKRVLREVHRLVEPGGEIHLAVPNGAAAGLHLQQSRFGHLAVPLHFWFYDEATLGRLLMEAGFGVTSVQYRMTWGTHAVSWRALRAHAGLRPALKEALAIALAVTVRRQRGDILKMQAHRL